MGKLNFTGESQTMLGNPDLHMSTMLLVEPRIDVRERIKCGTEVFLSIQEYRSNLISINKRMVILDSARE